MDDTTLETSTATSTGAAPAPDASASPDTAPAAPATAPRSFAEGIERLKAADDASTEREPATTAPETPAKVETTSAQPPARKQGPIPVPEHLKIIANAREKAVAEARPQIEAEVSKRYAWAEPVEEADREELTALYRGLKTDLIGTLTTLIDNASQHPEHAKTLRSQAARLLNAARRVQGDQPSESDEPPPDIPLEDGRAVYSADQLRKRDAWLMQQMSSQFDQKLQPFQQDRAQAQQREQSFLVHQKAADVLKGYGDKPYFTEHKADILAAMQAHPEWSLGDAYAEVLATKVLPTATEQGRTTALADIHSKAHAGTLSPQQTTTTFPTKPTGKFTKEIVERFFEAQT